MRAGANKCNGRARKSSYAGRMHVQHAAQACAPTKLKHPGGSGAHAVQTPIHSQGSAGRSCAFLRITKQFAGCLYRGVCGHEGSPPIATIRNLRTVAQTVAHGTCYRINAGLKACSDGEAIGLGEPGGRDPR
jgi:hypothetical protein